MASRNLVTALVRDCVGVCGKRIIVINIGSTFWYMFRPEGTVFDGWGQQITNVAKRRAKHVEARSHEVRIQIEQLGNQN